MSVKHCCSGRKDEHKPRLCDDARFVMVSEDGSRQCDITGLGDWDLTLVRNGLTEFSIDVDPCDCDPCSFEGLCDRIEFWLGDHFADDFLFVNALPQGDILQVSGTGLAARTQRERWDGGGTLSGDAAQLWSELWSGSTAGLSSGLTSGGTRVTFKYEDKDTKDKMVDNFAPYITWTQHSGVLYDWVAGEEPLGREITDDMLIRTSCDVVGCDYSTAVDDVAIAYGEELDRCIVFPTDAERCGRQSPVLEFPEIRSSADAQAMAESAFAILNCPQQVFSAADGAELESSTLCWTDLIPGRRHVIGGSEFGLASVRLNGTGNCVESVEARFDQAAIAALRSRVRLDD